MTPTERAQAEIKRFRPSYHRRARPLLTSSPHAAGCGDFML